MNNIILDIICCCLFAFYFCISSITDEVSARLSYRHKFSVNKANILELFQHVVEVRLWSSIKKISTYARHDRPKAFRLFPESLPSGERKRLSQYPLVSHDLIQTHWGKSKITNMASKQLKEEDSFLSLLSVESYGEGIRREGGRE